MAFTDTARTDFSTILGLHGISLTLRSRTASSFDGSDIVTYSTSDASLTAIWIDRITERELYNLPGRETEAESIAMIEYDTTVNKQDQILNGTTVYDVVDIIKRPDNTNTVLQWVLLKRVRP